MTSLVNPLDRLAFLPSAMNWRGTWGNADQYYRGDLAVSPTNNATYILFGTTADAGVDPISNVNWFELHPHATGVEGFSSGNGIGLTPPANNPTITNTGVRTITANTGLAWNGTTNTITNTGVLGIQQGAGITWDSSTNTLFNNGVVGTLRVGIGNTGTPQNQVLTNLGILSLTAGTGISVSTSNQTANISNTGVQSLTAGNGLINYGTSTNPILVEDIGGPTTSLLTPTGFCVPNPIPATTPNSYGVMPVTLSPTSKLQRTLTFGTTDPNPYWVFDFTGHWGIWSNNALFANIYIGFGDTTTAGGPFYYEAPVGPIAGTTYNGISLVTPNNAITSGNLGWTSVPLNDIRSAGLKTIDVVRFRNNIGGGSPVNPVLFELTTQTITPIPAHYYPNYEF